MVNKLLIFAGVLFVLAGAVLGIEHRRWYLGLEHVTAELVARDGECWWSQPRKGKGRWVCPYAVRYVREDGRVVDDKKSFDEVARVGDQIGFAFDRAAPEVRLDQAKVSWIIGPLVLGVLGFMMLGFGIAFGVADGDFKRRRTRVSAISRSTEPSNARDAWSDDAGSLARTYNLPAAGLFVLASILGVYQAAWFSWRTEVVEARIVEHVTQGRSAVGRSLIDCSYDIAFATRFGAQMMVPYKTRCGHNVGDRIQVRYDKGNRYALIEQWPNGWTFSPLLPALIGYLVYMGGIAAQNRRTAGISNYVPYRGYTFADAPPDATPDWVERAGAGMSGRQRHSTLQPPRGTSQSRRIVT